MYACFIQQLRDAADIRMPRMPATPFLARPEADRLSVIRCDCREVPADDRWSALRNI